MRISKKILAFLMAALMVVAVMPLTALADGGAEQVSGPGNAPGFPGSIEGTGQDATGFPGTAGYPVNEDHPEMLFGNTKFHAYIDNAVYNGQEAQYEGQTDDWYYLTLEAALQDAVAGDTIKLAMDLDLTNYAVDEFVNLDLSNKTLDLNGHTITVNGHWSVVFTGSNSTIKNGTFVAVNPTSPSYDGYQYAVDIWGPVQSSNKAVIPEGKISNVTLDGLTINYGIHVVNADVTVRNCNVTGSSKYYAVWADENASVTIESGNFTSSGAAVLGALRVSKPSCDYDSYITVKDGNFVVPTGLYNGKARRLVLQRGSSYLAPEHVFIKGGFFHSSDESVYNVTNDVTLIDNFSQNMTSGEVTQSSALNGANITVAETISQNFYIDADYYTETVGENVVATITYNHASNASETPDFKTETISLSQLPALDDPSSAYDGARMLSVLQAPAQSTEKITIKVYENAASAQNETGAVHEVDYSVYDYCKTIITDTTGSYTAVKPLAKATLDYAAAAQTYFNYNTENMATVDNGNAFYGNVESTDLTSVAGISSLPSCFNNYAVVVKSDLEIKLFTTTSISVTDATLSTTNGGERFSATTGENGDYYYVHIKGIEPANMDNQITVVTSEGDIVLTANSILKMMSKSTNANLATLGKAMYLYGAAANELFG